MLGAKRRLQRALRRHRALEEGSRRAGNIMAGGVG